LPLPSSPHCIPTTTKTGMNHSKKIKKTIMSKANPVLCLPLLPLSTTRRRAKEPSPQLYKKQRNIVIIFKNEKWAFL